MVRIIIMFKPKGLIFFSQIFIFFTDIFENKYSS
jgi:hypothetical protein